MLGRKFRTNSPGRRLAIISLVNTTGSGLWLTSSALYLTKFAGLSAADVGTGFAVAAAVCLVASTPMGYLADSRGPRAMQVLFYLVLAGLYLCMVAVDSAATFAVVASLIALADAGQRGARGALIAGTVPKEQRVRARAVNRMMANVGYTLGAALGGGAIALGTRGAYEWLIVGNAVSYLAIAALARSLPKVERVTREPAQPRLRALRDRPFLSFIALDGLMSVHTSILDIALPLWIVAHTHAPTWITAACFVVNTAMVVLLQVRTSRGTETIGSSVRASRTAAGWIMAACLVFALSAGRAPVLAAALLLLATFLHVLGELRHSAAGWGLSFGLAPPTMQGQYQAAYAMGAQLGQVVAPPLLVLLVVRVGGWGWIILGCLVLLPALAMKPVVDWNLRQAWTPDRVGTRLTPEAS